MASPSHAPTLASPTPQNPGVVSSASKVVRVLQGEVAVVREPCIVGSDSATSCIITIIRCVATRLVLCAHIDSEDSLSSLKEHASRLFPIGEGTRDSAPASDISLDVWVLGAIADGSDSCRDLLAAFRSGISLVGRKFGANIVSRGSWTLAENTDLNGAPLCQGLAYDSNKASAFPSRFEVDDKNVFEYSRRSALCGWLRNSDDHAKGRLEDVWDTNSRMYALRSFKRDVDANTVATMRYLLSLQSDRELLKWTSTTPNFERDSFPASSRQCLTWILDQCDSTGSIELCGLFCKL